MRLIPLCAYSVLALASFLPPTLHPGTPGPLISPRTGVELGGPTSSWVWDAESDAELSQILQAINGGTLANEKFPGFSERYQIDAAAAPGGTLQPNSFYYFMNCKTAPADARPVAPQVTRKGKELFEKYGCVHVGLVLGRTYAKAPKFEAYYFHVRLAVKPKGNEWVVSTPLWEPRKGDILIYGGEIQGQDMIDLGAIKADSNRWIQALPNHVTEEANCVAHYEYVVDRLKAGAFQVRKATSPKHGAIGKEKSFVGENKNNNNGSPLASCLEWYDTFAEIVDGLPNLVSEERLAAPGFPKPKPKPKQKVAHGSPSGMPAPKTPPSQPDREAEAVQAHGALDERNRAIVEQVRADHRHAAAVAAEAPSSRGGRQVADSDGNYRHGWSGQPLA